MQTLWIPICIVSGILQWSAGHVVYPIEPPRRTRHSIDEWRPLKDELALGLPRHSLRYSVYHKSPYSIVPKKSALQQTAENSDTVEVFSSAPPSILGSLSVFGHATVNAREPASRITLKTQRPQILQEQSEHLPYYRHHHIHHAHDLKSHVPLHQSYEERYLYDPSLRPPPPREHVAESAINLVPHPHSSSLTPNSYFFETPQPFQPPLAEIGNGFHKIRKPVYKPVTHNPYRLASNVQLYTSLNPLDQFKTPTHLPTSYEDNLSFDRGVNKLSKYNLHLSKASGLSSYYSRSPFGDIHLSTRRPDIGIKFTNQDRNNVKDEYDHYSQVVGRPFQKPPSFTPSPGPSPQKDYDNKPYVTTYPSISSTPNNPKYSSAPSFNFQTYDNSEVVSSVKPDYLVTHQPYTDDSYPYTVTTIEVPTETSPDTGKVNEDVQPSKSSWDQTVKSQSSFDISEAAHRPQLKINSFSGYNEREPLFLPTPSPETGLREPLQHDHLSVNNIRKKPSIEVNEYHTEIKSEDTTDFVTTEIPEITTKPPRPFLKNRRRPANKYSENFNKFPESDDTSTFKNHRPDNHKRRRKPTYGGRGGDRNRQSEFKKQRTTTTTPEPEVYEPTISTNEFSTIPVTEDIITNTQVFTTDISIKNEYEPSQNEFDQHSEVINYSGEAPDNEVKTFLNHKTSGYIEEPLTTVHPLVPLTIMTTTTTTAAPTTEKLETSTNPSSSISNRLKNKYGNNRPRFSVKDYRERLNRGTSTTTSLPEETTEKIKIFAKEQQDILKNTVRIRGSSQYKSSTEVNSSTITNDSKRKYKPRVGPSRYRITTTTASTVSLEVPTTTTERINTFRPSTNRYKPGTGKYYSRYRTSTTTPKEGEESTPAPTKIAIKPKGVFSAKRRPFPLVTRYDSDKYTDTENMPQDEVMHISQGEIELSKYPETIRNFENEVAPSTVITKKMDNEPTTTSSSEEKDDRISFSLVEPISDPTGLEALRIADLTSSSSNDFHTTGFRGSSSNHRPLPKIAFPTEEPILPLEAFFQTHANKD